MREDDDLRATPCGWLALPICALGAAMWAAAIYLVVARWVSHP